MGRKIVGSLTTVTSNLDNFIVAVLCCHFTNEAEPDIRGSEAIQERYLRAEQVAAYLKLADQSPTGFRGIIRAKKTFAESRIFLGTAPAAQLLASQVGYGLWGLYSSALKAAGLISGANRRLSTRGGTLVGAIIKQYGAARWDNSVALPAPHCSTKWYAARSQPHLFAGG